MARPKKGPTDAMKWLEKIERAKKVRAEWFKKFRISLAYDYYEGNQRPSEIPESEWITINKIYSRLEAILPSLYSVDPYFYIKLKTSYHPEASAIPLMEAKAEVRQAMLNYIKVELRLKSKCRLSIKDAFFQYGIAKVHFTADISENPKAGEVVLGEDGRPQLDENGQPITEVDLLPANEAYKISRIHPLDFLVDEDAGPDNDDVSWKAQRIKMALVDAKDDLRFPASIRKNLKATEIKDDDEKAREARKKGSVSLPTEKKDPDVIVLWEVYDLRSEEWLIVAEGNREFLIAPEAIGEEIDGDPFVDLRFTSRDDSWYTIPPISQWLDSQREYCDDRSKIMKHRKRFNRKYEMYSGAFDDVESEAAKLTSGDDGTVLIKSQPMQSVFPIPDGPLDMQVHTELAYLSHDFDELAVGPNQAGGTQGVDSATEAGILEKHAGIREGDRVSLVQDFVVDIGRKVDQCVQEHITKDQAIKVSGPQGELWVAVKKNDYESIQGEYEYSVNVGATTPQLPEIERAQLMSFIGTWVQAPQLFAECPTFTKHILESHHIFNEKNHRRTKNTRREDRIRPGDAPWGAGVATQHHRHSCGPHGRSCSGHIEHTGRRVTLPFLSINIETTDGCNRKCSFCPNSLIDKDPEFMPRELYEKILAELAEHKYNGRVHLYQRGEPLLDERLPEWTAMAREACPGSHLYISTNGDYLTRDLAKKLFRAGMNEIEVSHYDGIREELVRETSDFYGLVLHFDKKLSEDWHWFNRAGLVDIPSSMGTMADGLCWWIFRKAGISCRGDFQLCCADWFPGKFGNVKDKTIAELWDGPLLWKYRMAHTERRGKTMPLCDKCNLMEG